MVNGISQLEISTVNNNIMLASNSLFPSGLKVDLHELVFVELFIQSLDDLLSTGVVLLCHKSVHIFLQDTNETVTWDVESQWVSTVFYSS